MKQKIATSEWKVMAVLWQESNLFAAEIVKRLEETGWSDKTIKTLLARLVKKEFINYRKEGKSYCYYPLMNREDCIQKESRDFINKIFNGSAKDFMASFINNEKLSLEDIKELRELLDKREER